MKRKTEIFVGRQKELHQLENLVLNNAKFVWEKLGLHANDIVTQGVYFQRKTSLQQACQVDYMIQTRHHTLIAAEIKFSRHPIDVSVIETMREKIRRLKLPRNHACWPVLIHVGGVTEALCDEGYFTRIIDFGDALDG